MTTEMVPFDFSTIPANLKVMDVSANTLALAGSPPQGKRISIEGGVFRLFADGKEVAKNKDRDMDIVLVKTAPANNRVYYDPTIPYVRGQAVAPLCSSEDGVHVDAKVSTPQSDLCSNCPQNIAGSGTGESRACRYQRRIAVVLAGDLSGAVYQLVLPAKSLFGKGQGTNNLPLEAYARMLAMNNVSIDRMVTKMEFDTDASTPKLTFSPVRHLNANEIALIELQGNTPEAAAAVVGFKGFASKAPVSQDVAVAVTGVSVTAEVEPVAAPVAPAAPKKAAAKAKPAADDEPVAAPAATAEPTPAATRKEKIGDALSAWED